MSNYPDDVDSSTVLPGEDCPEMPDIKPCPFCESGYQDTSAYGSGLDDYAFCEAFSQVNCLSCGASGPNGDTLLAAINAWNRRVV